jgi:hypothetical protein
MSILDNKLSKLEELLLKTLENIMGKELIAKMGMDDVKNKILKPVIDALKTANPGLDDNQLNAKLSNDLRDEKFRKTVIHALVISAVNHKQGPANKFDLNILFKPKNEIDEKKLESELKKLFMKLYKLDPYSLKKSKQKQKTNEKDDPGEAEISALVNKLAKEILKDKNDEPVLKDPTLDAALTALFDPLANNIRMEYGGMDTRNPGAMPSVVQAIPNKAPWVEIDPGIFNKAAISEDRDIFSPDYSGSKRYTKINLLAIESISGSFEQELEKDGLIDTKEKSQTPTPFNTRPSPLK